MRVTVEIPDSLASALRLDEKEESRQFLRAFLLQRLAGGELSEGQIDEAFGPGILEETDRVPLPGNGKQKPARDVLARLQAIYGDRPLAGENAVLVARDLERY